MAGKGDPSHSRQDPSGESDAAHAPADSEPSGPRPAPMRTVPGLPRHLAEPTTVVLTGTAVWFAGAVLLVILPWGGGDLGIRFWSCLAGGILGVIGYGVFRWQRSASRRGSRGAWKGLAGLDE